MVGCQAVDQTRRYGVRLLDAALDSLSSGVGVVNRVVGEGAPQERASPVECAVLLASPEPK
jgi:hypothetical protein